MPHLKIHICKKLILVQLTPNDSPSPKIISQLSLQGPVRWDYRFSWLSDGNASTSAVHEWLMKRPWQTSQAGTRRFLGYEQAWDVVLALVLYLRTLQFQVPAPDKQDIHSTSKSPSRTGSQEECEMLQHIIPDMLDMVSHLTKLFAWPGIPPSLCYSAVTSRGAYLLGLWDYGPYQELVRLSASCLVSCNFVNSITALNAFV